MAKKPAAQIKDAVNKLAERNDRTAGKTFDGMFLGPDLLVVTLSEKRVIDGEWKDGDERADLIDQIDEYKDKDIATNQEAKESGWW